MNAVLINELDELFYSEKYERFTAYEVPSIDDVVQKWLSERGIGYVGTQIEDVIASGGVALERQGFLRGYEYALTMMGLNEGGTPCTK